MSGMVMSLLELHEEEPSLAAFLSALPSELQRHSEIAQQLSPGPADLNEIMAAVVETWRCLRRDRSASRRGSRPDVHRVHDGPVATCSVVRCGRPAATAFAELLEGRLFERAPMRTRAPAPRGASHRGAR